MQRFVVGSVNQVHSKSLERQFVEADGNITAALTLSKRCAHNSTRRCVLAMTCVCRFKDIIFHEFKV